MFLLRLLLKIILLPVMLAVILLQWVGIFLTSISGVIFFILSVVVFLIAVLSWVFKIVPGMEVLKMLAIAFVLFIVPHIGEWLVDKIAALNTALRGFIRA